MPIKTSSGKWKWGNVERSSKKELVQTVYGIWKKNGSKGSFSDFLKGTHESTLNEAKADLNNKIYFHGSASESMHSGQIDPPSLERPFYVTSDIDYAIAFSGKTHGNSGNTKRKFRDIKKTGQFVYAVSLSPNAEFFDFVNIVKHPKDISKYFPPMLALIIERAIKDWKYSDIYQFSSDLFFFIQGINKYYRQYDNDKGLELTNDILFVENSPLSMKEYKAAVDEIVFDYQKNILNGIKDIDLLGEMSNEWMFKNIHNLMGATLFKKMKEDGFMGVITSEEDTNEQLGINVATDNAIGIWDINALDKITTTAIPVSELKKIYSGIETLKFDTDEHKREVNAKIAALVDTIQTKQSVKESTEERYFVTDLEYDKHIKPILDIFKKWKRMKIGNITKHADDKSIKWFGIYRGRSIEDIVALAAVNIDKADKEIFFNQINSGEKGMGKFLTDKMIEHFKKNKNGCDHISWISDPDSGEKLKDFYRTNFPDAEETEEKNEWWQTSKFTLKLKESVEPKDAKTYAYHCTDVDPEIIKKEGWKVGDGFTLDNQFKDLYKKYLPNVPVFVSRLDVPVWDYRSKYCIKLDITGLKLFPDFGHLPDFGAYYDYDEECFYWENEDDLDSNKKLKDFVLDNCDNLTLYADCFDGEDSFSVLRTACVAGADLNRLENRGIVEFVDMKIGKIVMNESVVSEDKAAMIKKLVLPDIEDQKEKDDYKQELISFFKSHSNFENKVDWNKFKTLTKKDFDEVIVSADKTKGAEKRKEKAEIDSDIKNIFKSQKGREFFIAGENDRWLFVAPLNYEAAKFCDSSENQGAGAQWCIGYEKTDYYWAKYTENGSIFIMAFNKNYKNLSKEDLQTKLKYMIQRDKRKRYRIWIQSDKNIGNDFSIFGEERKIANKMFDGVKAEIERREEIARKKGIAKNEEILKTVSVIDVDTFGKNRIYMATVPKLDIPNNITRIGDNAFAYFDMSSITIPNTVTSIGNQAFCGCSNLEHITIPDSVTSIGKEAFRACYTLLSIVIPDNVKDLGDRLFFGCFNMTTIYCSEKIWNKFKDKFPENAERKDPEEFRNESVSDKINESIDRFEELEKHPTTFSGKVDDLPTIGKMYYCKEYRFAWKLVWDEFRKKSHIHVFEPSIINVAGSKRFGWREYLVTDDHQHMKEIDFKDFTSKERAQQEFKKLLEG